jgi:two-component system alkaline phosphatase synthesis response regulator PhoP
MTTGKRVLIVEDDPAMAKLLSENLQFEGYVVAIARTGSQGLDQAKTYGPDLILLDLQLPDGDGLEVCRRLGSAKDHVPVIMITARGEEEDRVRGFDVGADDYVVKPFALKELLGRIRAVLRRTARRVRGVSLDAIKIDFVRLRAMKHNRQIILTDREFEVLLYLASRTGMVISREELLQGVWGYSEAATTRTVDTFVFRLRQKIEDDPHHPKYLKTAYGGGYRLIVDSES